MSQLVHCKWRCGGRGGARSRWDHKDVDTKILLEVKVQGSERERFGLNYAARLETGGSQSMLKVTTQLSRMSQQVQSWSKVRTNGYNDVNVIEGEEESCFRSKIFCRHIGQMSSWREHCIQKPLHTNIQHSFHHN